MQGKYSDNACCQNVTPRAQHSIGLEIIAEWGGGEEGRVGTMDQRDLGENLALPVTAWVSLVKFLNFSEP